MITWPIAMILVAFFAMVAIVGRRDTGAAVIIMVVALLAGCLVAENHMRTQYMLERGK